MGFICNLFINIDRRDYIYIETLNLRPGFKFFEGLLVRQFVTIKIVWSVFMFPVVLFTKNKTYHFMWIISIWDAWSFL